MNASSKFNFFSSFILKQCIFEKTISLQMYNWYLKIDSYRFARNFSMPKSHRGKTSHRLETQNQGLRNQWFQACYPATDDGSYCLILEDDLELSPFWFTWLRKAWIKYGHREDIAGITLSVCNWYQQIGSIVINIRIYQLSCIESIYNCFSLF